MSAQLRLTLSDEQADRLDAVRGPATRTAYAAWLLARALDLTPAPQKPWPLNLTAGSELEERR